MNQFEFKPLQEKDLELLYLWFQESTIKQSYARERNFTRDDIKNKYLPRITGQENVPSFIVYQNNHPIGFIQYYLINLNLPEGIQNYDNPLFNQYTPDELAGIDCFIASAQKRGKGVGRDMINCFITQFLMDFKAIVVDPNKSNVSAIRCYEKAGFKTSNYSKDHHYMVMLKTTRS